MGCRRRHRTPPGTRGGGSLPPSPVSQDRASSIRYRGKQRQIGGTRPQSERVPPICRSLPRHRMDEPPYWRAGLCSRPRPRRRGEVWIQRGLDLGSLPRWIAHCFYPQCDRGHVRWDRHDPNRSHRALFATARIQPTRVRQGRPLNSTARPATVLRFPGRSSDTTPGAASNDPTSGCFRARTSAACRRGSGMPCRSSVSLR